MDEEHWHLPIGNLLGFLGLEMVSRVEQPEHLHVNTCNLLPICNSFFRLSRTNMVAAFEAFSLLERSWVCLTQNGLGLPVGRLSLIHI